MEKSNQIVPIDNQGILDSTFSELIKAMTGVVESEKKDMFISICHILQRTRSIGFLGALRTEWDELVKKGTISEDYPGSDQHLTCLHELFESLDHDILDERRFSLLKKIFLVGAAEILSTRDDVLPYQFLRLAKRLSSGEVLVLETVYRLYLTDGYSKERGAINWLDQIASESGLVHNALVELNEAILIELHLITPRLFGDGSGVNLGNTNRLTPLGIAFCDFIAKYEEL